MATVVYTNLRKMVVSGRSLLDTLLGVGECSPAKQIQGTHPNADVKLVDHAKREIPLNSYSYTFIEKSVRYGRLEDLEDHRAGQRTRPVGAVGIPARSSRTPFTLQDDQILWDWVQPYEKRGDQIAGNLIYQQLAEQNPRHTFQSWRDRYLKRLRHHGHRPGGPAQEAESTAPEQVSTVPKPRATITHISKPDSHAGSSKIKRDGRPTHDTAAANKRKRPSYEEISAVSNTEGDHSSQKRRRIPSPARAESDSQLETSDGSQSAKYETAPQFPVPEDSQIDDDDTLVPLTTHDEDTEENGDARALEAWIQKRIDSGRNGDHILQALSCTSMNAELADQVLDLLTKGKGIPKDMPGVWTEEDDEALTGQDGRAMERVMKKHGSEIFDERWQFLEQSARATQLVAQGE
ncbi:transcription factor Rap1, putative [Talaromyces marneffei ATCC 18224]|uniref:DNA-binding protein RAP1 n=1 Tax=Talaromyces marneffei (strain ATCC 18224 / CBS 334.59 / QM 7333) TaxID=441960 RepID=B6Q590_TALMQ|nr:transcription factor Rap1, putative [Talaromyces marneffei ATCC 18224]